MVSLGVEVLFRTERKKLAGKRIGLVSNYNVTDSQLRPIITEFAECKDWKLDRLFGPEHGLTNCAKEGENVTSGIDPYTGLPFYSLFGDTYKPTREMLEGLDVLVIDIPDVGCRYYTNMSTVAYCLDACAEVGLPCIVLDRPNPLGGISREGNLLDSSFKSFVGSFNIPVRHGLTMGELAKLHVSQMANPADLEVVRCEGWSRGLMWQELSLPFVSPSPNLSNPDMVALYPGTCLFEGTNISEGRGTTHPFEVIGAPFIDSLDFASAFNERQLGGVVARPTFFVPTYKKHVGLVCQGVQLHVTNPSELMPFRVGLHLLDLISSMYPEHFEFTRTDDAGRYFFDLLAGTNSLRLLTEKGKALDFEEECKPALESFEDVVSDLLLYDE